MDQPYFSILMCNVVNDSFTDCVFPDIWKSAVVDPRYKADDHRNVANYRPIAKLPNLSKVVEDIAADQIRHYVTSADLLYDFQSGFRKCHSPITAVTDLLNEILLLRDAGLLVAVIFIDFRKAFDLINHDRLLIKLRSQFGFADSAVEWLSSYLKNRTQSVQYRDAVSNLSNLTAGVPQGSILGPLLFLLYVNDIDCCLSATASVKLFADDTTLVVSATSREQLQAKCQLTMDNLSNYCMANQLFLHPNKTKIMYFQPTDDTPPVTCYGNSLETTRSHKYLGYVIDDRLTFKNHVSKITGKLASCRSAINRCSKFLDNTSIKLIANALASSHINYSHTILVVSDCDSLNTLTRVYNSIGRILQARGISWQDLQHRLITLNLGLIIRTMSHQCAPYLSHFLLYETANRRRNVLKNSHVNKAKTTKAFSYWASRLVNLLYSDRPMTSFNISSVVTRFFDNPDNSANVIPYNNPNNIMRN